MGRAVIESTLPVVLGCLVGISLSCWVFLGLNSPKNFGPFSALMIWITLFFCGTDVVVICAELEGAERIGALYGLAVCMFSSAVISWAVISVFYFTTGDEELIVEDTDNDDLLGALSKVEAVAGGELSLANAAGKGDLEVKR